MKLINTCTILIRLNVTVFAGDKAAVFLEEKISKNLGAAFTLQKQNSAVKTARPFEHMGL